MWVKNVSYESWLVHYNQERSDIYKWGQSLLLRAAPKIGDLPISLKMRINEDSNILNWQAWKKIVKQR